MITYMSICKIFLWAISNQVGASLLMMNKPAMRNTLAIEIRMMPEMQKYDFFRIEYPAVAMMNAVYRYMIALPLHECPIAMFV